MTIEATIDCVVNRVEAINSHDTINIDVIIKWASDLNFICFRALKFNWRRVES
jgi:hypothetical protein